MGVDVLLSISDGSICLYLCHLRSDLAILVFYAFEGFSTILQIHPSFEITLCSGFR
jgi:hypothetical protein